MKSNNSRIAGGNVVLISLLSTFAVAQESPWPMFRHDLKHSGYTPYTGPATPTLAWTFPVNDGIVSSPTIGTDGTIYFGAGWHFLSTDDHDFYALYPDGTLKWSFEGGSGFFSSAALGPDDTIYVTCLDGHLYALQDMGTHAQQQWKTYLDYSFALSSPAVGHDGTVYVGSPSFAFYAISPTDGAIEWGWYSNWCIISSPAIGDDGIIYVGSKDHYLYAFDDAAETFAWRFSTGAFYDGHLVDSSPAIGPDGTIYFGTDQYGAAGQTPVPVETSFWAVNPDGTLKWSFDIGDGVESSPAIGPDGTIYFGSYDGYLYALTDTGSAGLLKWKFETGDAIDGSPTVDGDGVIYFGSRDANVYALYPDGSEKWTFPVGDGIECSPTIDGNGFLYIGSFDGILYALGTGLPGIGTPDVGVVSVQVPPQLAVNGVYVPLGTVRNYRVAGEECEVSCVIEAGETIVYSDTISVSIPGGGSSEVIFSPWQVGGHGGVEYTVTMTTLLPGDENMDNDERSIQTVAARTNRYISFGSDNAGGSVAFQVEMTASAYFAGSVGVLGWVGEPDENGMSRVADTAYYSDAWPAVIQVGDCEIVPAATYVIRGTFDGSNFGDPLEVSTILRPTPKFWADVAGEFSSGAWSGPNGVVNIDDIMASVQRFQQLDAAPHLTWVDIEPEVPNAVLNFTDIFQIVQGFKGLPYPFSDPADCP